MPGRQVSHCRNGFESRVDALIGFALESRDFQIVRNGRREPTGHRRREMIFGMSLLHCHLAWEEFLESIFVRYLCGARTTGGFGPTLVQPPFASQRAAMTALLRSHGSNYVKWDHANTPRYARTYFKFGEPFTLAIGAVSVPLREIEKVRNRFVHRSDFSHAEFRNIVIRYHGYFHRGMTVGRFLSSPGPPGSAAQSMLEYYVSVLKIAGTTLVP